MKKQIHVAVVLILPLLAVAGWFGYGAWLDRAERQRLRTTVEFSTQVVDHVFSELYKGPASGELRETIVPRIQKLTADLDVLATRHSRLGEEQAAVLLYCRTAVTAAQAIFLFSMRGSDYLRRHTAAQEAVVKFWGAWARLKEVGYSESSLANRGLIAAFAEMPLLLKPEALGMTKQSLEALIESDMDRREKSDKR